MNFKFDNFTGDFREVKANHSELRRASALPLARVRQNWDNQKTSYMFPKCGEKNGVDRIVTS